MDEAGNTTPAAGHLQCSSQDAQMVPHDDRTDQDIRALLKPSRVLAALDKFFADLHPLPGLSFLHRTSLLQRWHAGVVDDILLLAIIAITSQGPDVDEADRVTGAECLEVAEKIIRDTPGRPSLLKVQALVLLIHTRIRRGEFSVGFLLTATLARSAFALRLNYENSKLCFLARESRRRLVWAVYTLDTRFAGGLAEFTLCPPDTIHLRLPCPEENFELDIEEDSEPLEQTMSPQTTKLGSLALYIRIMWFRDRVLRYTKSIVSSRQNIDTIPDEIREHEQMLDAFSQNLPLSATFSEKNLRLRVFSPWLSRYIMTHLWFQACYCDLYRCFLGQFHESFPYSQLCHFDRDFVLRGQAKCFQHAVNFTEICALVLALKPGNIKLDPEVADCTYHVARIILYGRIDPTAFCMTPDQVTERATHCLRFLQRLAREYPTVFPIVSPLPTNQLSSPVLRAKTSNILFHQAKDLGKLIEARGSESIPALCATSDAPDDAGSTESQPPTPMARDDNQIISKLSILNRSRFFDEGDTLETPSGPAPTTTTRSARGGICSDSTAWRTGPSFVDATLDRFDHRHRTDLLPVTTSTCPDWMREDIMTSAVDASSWADAYWDDQNNAFQEAYAGAIFDSLTLYHDDHAT
ncbi:uncharacterized protein PV07_00355 [Cladophialophora immunda]|uniref:Xylanolytic transcriptional activator regulatory domain-containing protein n=1 Tax=Cladophialophora immunda TaxID=569365 RepID=A0A0D2DCW1_9EURO|nr:uncharacterized protein PV07_00355 [Cladophialophora immunda]KIW33509.1 hypothetical protein PV07_00355 [Cladophialophora immunda]